MGAALEGCSSCSTVTGANYSYNMDQISSYYTKFINQPEQIKEGVPLYSDDNHRRLVNALRMHGQQFQDMMHPYQHLHPSSSTRWRRLKQVFPNEPFSISSKSFDFQLERKSNQMKITANLDEALMVLKNYPSLLEKIFQNCLVSKEGFYALSFCQGGNIQKKSKKGIIVIDDFVPVDDQGAYLYSSPFKGQGIWMILLHKAWAKILTSYIHLQYIPSEYFVAEMTGIPKQNLYTNGDYLTSAEHNFNIGESKYLKILRDSPVLMTLTIWQQMNPDLAKTLQQNDFIIEVIEERVGSTSKQYRLLPVYPQRVSNKLIAMTKQKQMFQLPQGQSIIHIFNRTKSKRSCNIVLHSKKPVSLHTRNQKQFQEAKRAMIKSQFRKIYHSISTQYEFPDIETKFTWINHRGIFCIKNKSAELKHISLEIKKGYLGDIWFEDSQDMAKSVELKANQHGFFVVVRAENQEYGPFYQIKLYR